MADQATRAGGASPPPPGREAGTNHPGDALYSISLGISLLTLTLPMPLLLLRGYTAWKISTRPRLDDWSCATASLLGTAYLTSGVVFAVHGGGHHVWDVTGPQLRDILGTAYWSSIVYSAAALLIKATLLLAVVRVFRATRPLRYLGYCLMAVMVGYYVPVTVLKVMMCVPTSAYWDGGSGGSPCYYRPVFLADAIGAPVTDMMLLLMGVPLLWAFLDVRAKIWLVLVAGIIATSVSLVRMVLILSLEVAKDPALDFVRLNLFGQIEIAVGLMCTCLATVDDYLQSRKGPEGNLQRSSQPSMRFRNHSPLDISSPLPQRLDTPERTAPAGGQVEGEVLATRAYSRVVSLRPPSYSLQPPATRGHATPPASLGPAAQSTPSAYQANDTPPPIPKKSTARLSMYRKSWAPATTPSSYVDAATQATEDGAPAGYSPETRSDSPLDQKDWLPCSAPPLFSRARGISPIPEVITPASTASSARHSPGVPRLSPRWNRWARSPARSPSPPMLPVGDVLKSLGPPQRWQSRHEDHNHRPYSV